VVALVLMACGSSSSVVVTSSPTPHDQGLIGRVAVVQATPVIHAFVRGSNGRLYDRYWNGGAWQWLALASPPNVAISSDPNAIVYRGLVYCFVTGADGHLFVNVGATNTTQRSWQDLGSAIASRLAGRPAVVAYSPVFGGAPSLFVFTRGAEDGHLYVTYGNGDVWQMHDQGRPTDGPVVGDPGAGTYNVGAAHDIPRIYAFARGSSGHLYENYWEGPTPLAGAAPQQDLQDFGAPQGTAVAGVPSVSNYVLNTSSNFYVFARGTNGMLNVDFWDGARWNWAEPTESASPQPMSIAGDPASDVYGPTSIDCTYAPSRLYAFARGSTGHLLEDFWNGAHWVWEDFGTPTSGLVAGDPGTVVTNNFDGPCTHRFYVFVTTTTGHLAVDYWTPTSAANLFQGTWTWADEGNPLVCTGACA
jgi:hypothetical protein